VATGRIVCRELLDGRDPALPAVRRLYETTQAAGERIPWSYLARAADRRADWRPGRWCPHLLAAADATDPDRPRGFAYGAHVPGLGGYLCYLGVEESARGRGIGTRLFLTFFDLVQADATCEGVPLPFVLWESHAPEPGAPPEELALWRARLRQFAKVGARWLAGVTFQTPNFADRGGPPVPLQLFLVPRQAPAERFDAGSLRAVVAALHARVFDNGPGDLLYELTLPPDCRPELRPVADLAAATGA
jgi:GNAT superfamily N-acetyltransferase